MTPSYRRKTKSTRKSSSRRGTCLNKTKHFSRSKNVENSAVSPAISPAKHSNGGYSSPKHDEAEVNVDLCCNSSNICSTPKAERFRIPEISTCPPAPKKRRIPAAAAVAATCSFRRIPVAFFAPPDIELFFYFALRGIPV